MTLWEKEKMLVPLYHTAKFLDFSKLKAYTDDKIKVAQKLIFTFRFGSRGEYIEVKGENTDYHHSSCFFFFFFPKLLFSRSCCKGLGPDTEVLVSVKLFTDIVSFFTQPFPKQSLVFTCLQYKPFENTVGKGEIARNEQFLLFPQRFLLFWRT